MTTGAAVVCQRRPARGIKVLTYGVIEYLFGIQITQYSIRRENRIKGRRTKEGGGNADSITRRLLRLRR